MFGVSDRVEVQVVRDVEHIPQRIRLKLCKVLVDRILHPVALRRRSQALVCLELRREGVDRCLQRFALGFPAQISSLGLARAGGCVVHPLYAGSFLSSSSRPSQASAAMSAAALEKSERISADNDAAQPGSRRRRGSTRRGSEEDSGPLLFGGGSLLHQHPREQSQKQSLRLLSRFAVELPMAKVVNSLKRGPLIS